MNKKANEGLTVAESNAAIPDIPSPEKMPTPKNTVHGDAQRAILHTVLAGLGAGAGFRGLTGLLSSFQRPAGMEGPNSYKPTIIDIPYPRRKRPEDVTKLATALIKSAFLNMQNWVTNPHATSMWDVPYLYPAGILGGAAALYGGYKGMDSLIKHRQEDVLNSELEDSRKRYHQAIVTQYIKPYMQQKKSEEELVQDGPEIDNDDAQPSERAMEEYAGDDYYDDFDDDYDIEGEIEGIEDEEEKEAAYASRIGIELEGLYRAIREKRSAETAAKPTFEMGSEIWPKITGGYLTAAGGLFAGSAALAHHFAGQRDPQRLLDEAIKAREDEAAMRRPREIFIRPKPIDIEEGKEKEQIQNALANIRLPEV